ncbi:hypothetical protein [Tenacibaculum xiamenense]|uniref:hypothetical protein n=1 Tax=Tenacibaculum xiamenense TaxID=1261553 RepID=UPI0038930E9D
MKRILFYIFFPVFVISCANNDTQELIEEEFFPTNSNGEFLTAVIADNRNHPGIKKAEIVEFLLYENNRPTHRFIDIANGEIENRGDYENFGEVILSDEIHRFYYNADNKVKETRVYNRFGYSFKYENNRIHVGGNDVTDDENFYSRVIHTYEEGLLKSLLEEKKNNLREFYYNDDLEIIRQYIENLTYFNRVEIKFSFSPNKIIYEVNDFDNEILEGNYRVHNSISNPYHKILMKFGVFSYSIGELVSVPLPFGLFWSGGDTEWFHRYFVEAQFYPGNDRGRQNTVKKTNSFNYPTVTSNIRKLNYGDNINERVIYTYQ